MKKSEVEHVLRAAGDITGEKQFIIIGSQSIHAKYPDKFESASISLELDLYAKKHPELTDQLNVIGHDSPFHEMNGYYADPVDARTAVLPKGWEGRLVHLPATGATNGVSAQCLEPHDLLISKYVAHREKDIDFNREVIRSGVIDVDRLLKLLETTKIDEAAKARIRGYIVHDRSLAPNNKSDVPAPSLVPKC